MAKKPTNAGRRGDPVSLHPLKPDDAMREIFQTSNSEVWRIVAGWPAKTRGGKK